MPDTDKMNTPILTTIKKDPIRLHLNPATDSFQFIGLEDTALLTVSDMHCRVFLKMQISGEENISVSSLRKGVYIAKITSGTCTIEKKLEKK